MMQVVDCGTANSTATVTPCSRQQQDDMDTWSDASDTSNSAGASVVVQNGPSQHDLEDDDDVFTPPPPPPLPPPDEDDDIHPLHGQQHLDYKSYPSSRGVSDDEDHDYIVGYLGKITDQAEARLAAKRQARAEAREIRMRELERQQKEAEQSADRVYDLYSGMPLSPAEVKPQKLIETTPVRSRAAANSQRAAGMLSAPPATYQSSRRSSEDSMEEGISLRDVRQELKELEDKFRKAMFHNAQLDNEKASFVYQVELLKDQIEQLEEAHSQLQREHREKCREHEQLKRDSAKLKEEMEMYKSQLEERDRLIQEHGLVIVGEDELSSEEESSDEDEDSESTHSTRKSNSKRTRKALVSVESAQLLDSAGQGSLAERSPATSGGAGNSQYSPRKKARQAQERQVNSSQRALIVTSNRLLRCSSPSSHLA
ncbi:hypothetical protein B566_EDAN006404 [Ephemera danica]|nr:hypothetical protein B566_EDAN006404 [Ephemera danica]